MAGPAELALHHSTLQACDEKGLCSEDRHGDFHPAPRGVILNLIWLQNPLLHEGVPMLPKVAGACIHARILCLALCRSLVIGQ